MTGARVAAAASGQRLAVGSWPLVAGAGALGLAAIVGARLDPALAYRWPLFWLHLLAVALAVVAFARDRWDGRRLRAALTRAELLPLGVVLALAAAASFAWLANYPFVALGDEVRDSGLYTLQILDGTRKNIFGYGELGAHGLVIPTLSAPFYYLFGSSPLAYRVPAALVAVADVFVVYLLVRLAVGRVAAFWAGLFLVALPLHLAFSRTELVVSFSSFWTSLILLLLWAFLRRPDLLAHVLLGTALGFAAGFHAALRPVIGLACLVVLFADVEQLRAGARARVGALGASPVRALGRTSPRAGAYASVVMALLLFGGFLLVGLGPRALYTTRDTLFGGDKLVSSQPFAQPSQAERALNLQERYVRSLLVWFKEPAVGHYPDYRPILPAVLALCFAVGIAYNLTTLREPILDVAMLLAVIVPFTNSAATDILNMGHRLAPLLPVGAILAGVGVSWATLLVQRWSRGIRWPAWLLSAALGAYTLVSLASYFLDAAHAAGQPPVVYLNQYAVQVLQAEYAPAAGRPGARGVAAGAGKQVCIAVAPGYGTTFDLPHYHQQRAYFAPGVTTTITESRQVAETEVFLIEGPCGPEVAQPARSVVACETDDRFLCPRYYRGRLTVYY
jgi:4-amino-4-deoxy-L-arabinose transferase-like glycosyltransferase